MSSPSALKECWAGAVFLDPLMLRPASLNPGDMLADAAYPILLKGGARALTLRAMARELRTPIGTFTDWAPPREKSFHLVAARLGGRWEDAVKGKLYRQSFAAFLPTTDEEMDACRVWLAVEELGRSFPLVAMAVAEAHVREQGLLRSQGAEEAEPLHAVLRGLRLAIADPGRPMKLTQAHQEWLDTVLHRCRNRDAS